MRGRMMLDSDLLTACMSYSRELCAGSATHAWGSDCNMQGDDAGFLGHWNSDTKVARNCNVTGGANNVGCQMRSQDNASCGEAFNQLGSGGAYVTLLLHFCKAVRSTRTRDRPESPVGFSGGRRFRWQTDSAFVAQA